MHARGLLSLLYHGKKALDLVAAASEVGIVARLDQGPATLRELCEETRGVPNRLYKLMDGLESLGLVVRTQPEDDILLARYHAPEPLGPAIQAVLGPESIEKDRDGYPWQETFGRLPEILRAEHSPKGFSWPPSTEEQVAEFERSMAAGAPPIVEALTLVSGDVFGKRGGTRWLDVGGGDGVVAEALLATQEHLRADVFNLPAVAPLVQSRAEKLSHNRLGFVGGDFLAEPLPKGYDVISFVRVLHDWPADRARTLIEKAYEALPSGGTIVICEEFRSAERLAIQFFWTYFLVGVDSCVSRLRERSWYEEALTRAGFRDIECRPGAFEVVLARKP
jgi:demethylspheroidene O-methyltransferase